MLSIIFELSSIEASYSWFPEKTHILFCVLCWTISSFIFVYTGPQFLEQGILQNLDFNFGENYSDIPSSIPVELWKAHTIKFLHNSVIKYEF